MKKRLFILICLLIQFLAFSQDIILTLNKDSTLIDENLKRCNFSKDEQFVFKTTERGIGISTENPLNIYIIVFDSYGKKFKCPISSLYLDDKIILDEIKSNYWVPSYYYDLINSNNVINDLLKFESYWINFKNTTEDYNAPWLNFVGIQKFYFGEYYFLTFGNKGYNSVGFVAFLEETADDQLTYNIQKMYSNSFDYKFQGNLTYNQPEFLPLYERETPFKIIFIIDGDYMYMYIDEVSDKNLFQTLVRTTPEACDQIENYILGKSKNLSAVVMPKHGTSTSIKTVSKPSTNVAVDKTLTTNCNLKLRSGEATSTQVLTVMSAGTKVKVIELGKEETIDNIKSNWVKVEIISGKDRDGKILKSGMTGWCYGGYLQ